MAATAAAPRIAQSACVWPGVSHRYHEQSWHAKKSWHQLRAARRAVSVSLAGRVGSWVCRSRGAQGS
eukprot:5373019-Prymnesium_polylepis.1